MQLIQNPKKVKIGNNRFFELLILILWIIIGGFLRFLQLTAKPPWTDEFATMVFSLGNDYKSVLLNQSITINALLQPLQPNLDATLTDVVSLILHEDNHPPLYFLLAHLWMKLFPTSGGYISLLAARSLPALLGVLSIPLMYYLTRLAFRSRIISQLSVAMIAMSPYGVFLAQEARHYTLAMIFVILSLCCLVGAFRHLWEDKIMPLGLVWLWIIINVLGLTTHYFFSITLCAEVITLMGLVWMNSIKVYGVNRWRLVLVGVGTVAIALIWVLGVMPGGNGMTAWIQQDNSNFITLISPIFQLLAAWVTMLCLLPVESSSLGVVIASGLGMLLFLIWAIPKLYGGLKILGKNYPVGVGVLGGFVVSAIALFFAITYILGMDITRGARYSFVYFPGVIALLGASLGVLWNKGKDGKIGVNIILIMGLVSALTVCFNLGYQKYYRPDQLVPVIEQHSSDQIIIATTHQSLVETGEMMGIAYSLLNSPLEAKTSFLLAHQNVPNSPIATETLQKTVNKIQKPLDVWAVNFDAPIELKQCQLEQHKLPPIDGYNYQKYHCK